MVFIVALLVPDTPGFLVCCVIRFSGAPVDFEEVQVTSSTTEAGLNNAILALVRNGVGIKGRSWEAAGCYYLVVNAFKCA